MNAIAIPERKILVPRFEFPAWLRHGRERAMLIPQIATGGIHGGINAGAVGAPSAPDLCRVYGYEYLNGNAVEGRKILAYLQGAPQASGTVLLEQVPDQTETDADGYWYLDLVSNKEYKIKVDGAGVNQVFTIPDVVSVNLKDLL